MLQNPHRHRSGGRPETCGAWLRFPQTIEAGQQCRRTVPRRDKISPAPAITTRSHEKTRPAQPLQRLFREKLAQRAQKRQIWGVVSAQGELFRAFAMTSAAGRTISRPNETATAFARSFTGTHETSDTFARPQCRKNTHFERAKVMAVSPTHKDRATKVTAVSAWQRVAPKRQAMRQARCGRDTCAVTTRPDRAPRRRANQRPSATGAEGAGGTGGHGRASRRGAERSEVA